MSKPNLTDRHRELIAELGKIGIVVRVVTIYFDAPPHTARISDYAPQVGLVRFLDGFPVDFMHPDQLEPLLERELARRRASTGISA